MSSVNGGGRRKRGGPRTSTEEEEAVKQASKLRVQGLGWPEIAGLTGYQSPAAARLAVNRWQQKAAFEMSVDERAEALREAVQGYDELIAHWWADAHEDLGALREVRALMGQRDHIKRLATSKQDTGMGSTLVVGGTEEQYLAGLAAVIADPN